MNIGRGERRISPNPEVHVHIRVPFVSLVYQIKQVVPVVSYMCPRSVGHT